MDGEGSVDKYVKTEDVALTQAFTALFGVFMETLKVCVLFDTNTTLIVTEWFLFSSTLVTSSRIDFKTKRSYVNAFHYPFCISDHLFLIKKDVFKLQGHKLF